MALSNDGRDAIAALITGGGGAVYDNTNAYLGVGDSNTAFAGTQTDLQGSGTRVGMEATYPTVSGSAQVYRSLFGTGQANQAWAEWGVFNASASGTMLSRKVEDLGTKTSAQSWQLTATLNYDNP